MDGEENSKDLQALREAARRRKEKAIRHKKYLTFSQYIIAKYKKSQEKWCKGEGYDFVQFENGLRNFYPMEYNLKYPNPPPHIEVPTKDQHLDGVTSI